jgi:predicted RNase H-like HicB family nuclease
MNEQYTLRITKKEDGFAAVVLEIPELYIEASTYDEAALEIERLLVIWKNEQKRREVIPA